jgi:hypothetical protein
MVFRKQSRYRGPQGRLLGGEKGDKARIPLAAWHSRRTFCEALSAEFATGGHVQGDEALDSDSAPGCWPQARDQCNQCNFGGLRNLWMGHDERRSNAAECAKQRHAGRSGEAN